jgi:O-antigen/teichoic acid export membrane protein
MSAAANDKPLPAAATTPLRADSLAVGVAVLFSLAIAQRVVGLVRSVLFCRLLPDDQLGTWSLALSFLLLAAPLAVLGLPGSFGRYAERYRQRGQLAAFLRRTMLVIGVLSLLAVTAVCLARKPIAWLVFGDSGQAGLMLTAGIALLSVIGVNCVVDLLTALRQVRMVSLVQFAHSIVFAAVGLGLLFATPLGAAAVVVAYAAGSLAGMLVAVPALAGIWRSTREESASDALGGQDLWSRLLPFAGWIWVANLLTNLFEMADRYMIVHFAPGSARHVQALVGQYHSSRVLPLLMVAAAGMLATVVLPYLSHDWEAGRREQVSRRLNTVLKLTGLAVFFGGAVLLAAAPLVFAWALDGRYNDGLAVLPWTTAYAAWFGISLVATNYLLCAERARLANIALFAGLAINIALNLALLPLLGLIGAVLATAAANAAALALVFYFSRMSGMTVERGTLLCAALPLLLGFGGWSAVPGVLITAWIALRTDWIFTATQRDDVRQLWQDTLTQWLRRPRTTVSS